MINNLCQYTYLSEEEIIDIIDEYIVKPVMLDKNAIRNDGCISENCKSDILRSFAYQILKIL